MTLAAAVVVTAWAAWRWMGFVAGMVRMFRLDGATRREARRTVIGHGAIDVAFSVGAVYLWALATDVQFTETMVGFLAAVVMISLAIGVASRLMQPPVRLPHTVGICRVMGAEPDTPVEPVGTPMTTDRSGAFVPQAVDRLEDPWDAAVEHLADAVERRIGGSMHSLYVRGSVAKAMAVEGRSDIDAIAVLHGEVGQGWDEGLESEVLAGHPFVTGLDMLVLDRTDVFADGALNHDAFVLATQAHHVRGPDLRAELPRFGFGPWAFRYAPHLGEDLGRAIVEPNARTWITRRIVRTAFEAVMVHEGTYTRELYPCYEAFRRHHPERADELWRALELAVDPTDDREAIVEVCEGIGRYVAEEGAKAHKRARDHGGLASALPGVDDADGGPDRSADGEQSG